MKHTIIAIFFSGLLLGCAQMKYQRDVSSNEYEEKMIYADANAAYVGEWTALTNVGVRSLKIKEDGRIKICLSPSTGTEDGKVYFDNGTPAFIIETGAKVEIVSMNRDLLVLDVYGRLDKYYAGQVPEECAKVFKLF